MDINTKSGLTYTSKIEANEYIFGFIFYKYLSDQLVQFVTMTAKEQI